MRPDERDGRYVVRSNAEGRVVLASRGFFTRFEPGPVVLHERTPSLERDYPKVEHSQSVEDVAVQFVKKAVTSGATAEVLRWLSRLVNIRASTREKIKAHSKPEVALAETANS
jgi:hypothetical protein